MPGTTYGGNNKKKISGPQVGTTTRVAKPTMAQFEPEALGPVVPTPMKTVAPGSRGGAMKKPTVKPTAKPTMASKLKMASKK
jgi:hypothetical protein